MRTAVFCVTLVSALTGCLHWPPEPAGFTLCGKEFRATETIVIAGQPDEARIQALVAAGFERFVSINGPKKAPKFDEAAVVKAAGAEYANLPISKETIKDKAVRAEAYALLAEIEADGKQTCFHCSTANRAGAIWALYVAEHKGRPAEEALAAGKAVGLTKLEPYVREALGLPAKGDRKP